MRIFSMGLLLLSILERILDREPKWKNGFILRLHWCLIEFIYATKNNNSNQLYKINFKDLYMHWIRTTASFSRKNDQAWELGTLESISHYWTTEGGAEVSCDTLTLNDWRRKLDDTRHSIVGVQEIHGCQYTYYALYWHASVFKIALFSYFTRPPDSIDIRVRIPLSMRIVVRVTLLDASLQNRAWNWILHHIGNQLVFIIRKMNIAFQYWQYPQYFRHKTLLG